MVDAEAVPPISVTQQDGARVVEFTQNRIVDPVELAGIEKTIFHLIDEEPSPRLVLDFENVENLSSAALGMLMSVRKRIRQENGRLKLAHLRPELQEVFEITRLEGEFDIRPSVEDAAAAMKS